MSFFDWLAKLFRIFSRAGHRSSYNFRKLRSDSIKMRKLSNEFYKEEKQLEKDSHQRFTDKIIEHLQKENKDEQIILKEILDVLKDMGTDIVMISDYLPQFLKEIVLEDERIKAEVPTIQNYEKQAMVEFAKFERLLNELGHAFQTEGGIPSPFALGQSYQAMLEASMHRKSYPIRDIYREIPHLLKDKKIVAKAERQLKDALRDHILNNVLSSEKDILDSIKEMIEELHHIALDVIVLYHLNIKGIEQLITDEKKLSQVESLRPYVPMLMKELGELKKIAKDTGAALLSESRQSRLAAAA